MYKSPKGFLYILYALKTFAGKPFAACETALRAALHRVTVRYISFA